ncbi:MULTISPECIES: hypothetical protein [Nostocales]|uniref:Uncharacterized protein n=3 Tax=Nostocales TaxID=1161 RepID=A0A0C1MYT3_9CYAN|nr:hypothetical protein [Tolypothrix bouteillei]KAF3889044.1 hypothetical protein DA73_0400028875 [Tolypothrix bouteillei VB521301]
MKNKIVAILAAATALGSSLFAAPAQAVQQDVNVEITVSPVLFLRTFETVSLQITNQDLGSLDKDVDTINRITDGTTSIDRTTPVGIGEIAAGTIKKPVKELFAVWSNSSNGVDVTVTPVTGSTTLTNTIASPNGRFATATLSDAKAVITDTTKPTTAKPLVGGAELSFDLTSTAAGKYVGAKIRVEALPKF